LSVIFVPVLACSPSTEPLSDTRSPRELVEVSGPISEDAVWESGKEYYVTGDVTVESGATLTIEPDAVVKFAHERADDYYGVMVEGTLIADGVDSTTAILFMSGAPAWAREPGDWRGIEIEATSDSSSVIRYCRIEYANVGIKADGSSPDVRYCVVEQCADTGILFNGSDWGGVLGCMVRENKNGIRFELVEHGVIARCAVQDNEENGIECKTSSPDIEDNQIQGNGWGIYCWYGASPGIRWNTFVDQKTGGIGQFRDCFSEIEGNIIVQHTGDGIGIYHAVPHIMGNNLISKSNGHAVKLAPAWSCRYADVDATVNYWGSGDPVEIGANIYDGMDTYSTLDPERYHSRVVFTPFEGDSIRAIGRRIQGVSVPGQ
jgi:hypothetical protein